MVFVGKDFKINGLPMGTNCLQWMTVVTSTNRPKSVRNRCVIEVFWWRFCVVHSFSSFLLV